ncbi:MAG: hypothetical protein OXG82_05440 [Gammaproteobacteria bacterium]|nr:hypothetical protein [Gammaproteobacteria bacterium]
MSEDARAEVRFAVQPRTGRLRVEYSAGALYFYVGDTEVLYFEPRTEDGDYSKEYLDLIDAVMPLGGAAIETVLNHLFDIENKGFQPNAVAMLSRVLARWEDIASGTHAETRR